jgi:outer membrane protein OmpA-like peptidoglycan-associated protein
MSLRQPFSVVFILAIALGAPSLVSAQSLDRSGAEVFGGYSWYRTGGKVNGVALPDFPKGWASEFTYNVDAHVGVTADFNGHYNSAASAFDFALGPRFRLTKGPFTPFAEALLGVQHLTPKGFPSQNAPTYIFGGGLDLKVTPQLSLRAIQADYVFTNYTALTESGVNNNFSGFRMQTGVVYRFGPGRAGQASAACSAEPAAVDAGESVKISVTPAGFLAKRTLSYSYSTTGGKVAPGTTTATADTVGLAPGSYTVSVRVDDSGKGKHQESASCQATFTVNPKRAPEPAPAAMVAPAAAPEAAVPPAAAEAKAGPAAAATAPPAAPEAKIAPAAVATAASAPAATKFGILEFKVNPNRPTRVDNEAKGELDRYADALAAAPDAKAVIVGYARTKEAETPEGRKAPGFAAQRGVNTKDYLTREKGVDGARIEVRTGSGNHKKVELWIVPAGSSFKAASTRMVDETQVKAVPRIPLKVRKSLKAPHKKASKPV